MDAIEGGLNLKCWPETPEGLVSLQEQLALLIPEPWHFHPGVRSFAGCWICNPKGLRGKGAGGDHCWAAAALMTDGKLEAVGIREGKAPAAYEPGLLALREGPMLEAALSRLPRLPEILLVNATARDHPRRAGLALHLGAKLGVPTVGVTRQPLISDGPGPAVERGASSPLQIGGEVVACWLRTRRGIQPLVVHPAWRTGLETAVAVVMELTRNFRVPEPLRAARRAARESRSRCRR